METVQNKSGMHIQSQIRHNAEELKNTLNDLYSWEKEMKDKEQKLKLVKESNDATSYPIRSQPPAMEELGVKISVNQPKNKTIEAEEEKQRRLQLAETFKERGNKNVKLGDYQTAVENYTAAIEAFENDPKFYTNRALCYIKLEKYDECIEDCNRAIEIDNLSVKAYYRRMQANECLGFNTKALKDCTAVLMIDSKNSDAKASLKRINQRLKKTGAVPKGYSTGDSTLIEGPHFSPLRSNTIDILPTNKPSYARSKKPLKKIPIIDVIGPKDGKNFENSNIQISDEVIDKLFNGECGSYEEVKKTTTSENVNTQLEVQDSNKISPDEIAPKPTKLTKLEAELSSTTKDRPLPPPPTSTAQFYCNWKELSAQQKYQYLKSIEVSQMNRILGAGFDSDILSDLLKTLNEFYVSNKEDACETLLEISKHDRLPILSLLLSSDDTTALSQIIDYIQKCNGGGSTESINLIKKSFNLD